MKSTTDANTHWELLSKFLAGEASPHEIEQLEAWREKEGNQEYYEKSGSLWKTMEEQKEKIDIDRAWEQVRSKSIKTSDDDAKEVEFKLEVGKTTPWTNWIRWAAILVLTSGLVWISYRLWFDTLADLKVVQTNNQGNVDLSLPDGSKVWINRNSTLKYPETFDKSSREIHLEGQAYFEIAAQSQRPFIIHTAEADIEAVGTRFDLDAYPQQDLVTVTVLEGEVNLSTKISGASIIVEAGYKGFLQPSTQQIQKSEHQDLNSLAWKSGILKFAETHLDQVVETLEHAYGVKLMLTNHQLQNCQWSADFKDQSLDEVLEILQMTFNLQIIHNEGHIEIDGSGC